LRKITCILRHPTSFRHPVCKTMQKNILSFLEYRPLFQKMGSQDADELFNMRSSFRNAGLFLRKYRSLFRIYGALCIKDTNEMIPHNLEIGLSLLGHVLGPSLLFLPHMSIRLLTIFHQLPVYIHVCMYIQVYTHIYIYIHMYIYVYTHIYIYVYICKYTQHRRTHICQSA